MPELDTFRRKKEINERISIYNTSSPDERTFLLKTLDKNEKLPDKATDIESDNIIKGYQGRPRKLEELCLLNFCCMVQLC